MPLLDVSYCTICSKGFIVQTKALNSINADDAPRSLRYSDVLERRKAKLHEAHIAPLTDYVKQMRKPGVEVPYFDPLDGGVNAEILFLLEKPGRKTATIFPGSSGSGFISRNNNDQTAEATWKFMNGINLPRAQTVIWNVMPWWNGTINFSAVELREGAALVKTLVENLLTELKVIVLVGNPAQSVRSSLDDLGLEIICSAHPSQRVKNCYPDYWHNIPTQWGKAKACIDAAQEVK